MKHVVRAQSISWFQKEYKEGRLILRPPFQRKPVWLDKQRCALIESVLLDVPIPELYVQVSQADDGTEAFGVVDGQQRLRSILQFVGLERSEDQQTDDYNNFSLATLSSTSPFKDKTFADLSTEVRKRFFQYELGLRMLYTDDTKEIEDVFKRLNKFGMPLKPQELRNATFHGAFAKLSEALADDDYWAVNRIVTPAAIRRMSDIEMMSDLLVGLIHGPQGGSAKILDEYYEQYEDFDLEFPEQNRIKRLFYRTRSLIERLFPKIADVPRWGNRADFYSLFVALGDALRDAEPPRAREKDLREAFQRFATEVDGQLEGPQADVSAAAKSYAKAIEKGSNEKARRVDRHKALLELIDAIIPGRK
jgi:hypothetical protein